MSAPDEAAKRDRAIELLDDNRGGVSVQVLQEFFVQATRATRPDRLTQEVATRLICTWLRCLVVFPGETHNSVIPAYLGRGARFALSDDRSLCSASVCGALWPKPAAR